MRSAGALAGFPARAKAQLRQALRAPTQVPTRPASQAPTGLCTQRSPSPLPATAVIFLVSSDLPAGLGLGSPLEEGDRSGLGFLLPAPHWRTQSRVGRHGPMPVEPPALPLAFPLTPVDTTVSLPPGPTPTLLQPRLQQHSAKPSSPSPASSLSPPGCPLWNALSPCPSARLPLANPAPLSLEAFHGFNLEALALPKAWTGACRTASRRSVLSG